MNKQHAAKVLAHLLSLLDDSVPAKPKGKFVSKIKRFDTSKLSPAVVSDKTERQLVRYAAIAKGFHRKGLKNSEFTLQSGGSDTVKTYKGWLAAGRQVKRKERGVKGMFHITQTEQLLVNVEPVTVPVGQVALSAMG